MKKRVNRRQLENETWSCVAKYNPAQLNTMSEKISKECFTKWANDYYTKNQDLIKLLNNFFYRLRLYPRIPVK